MAIAVNGARSRRTSFESVFKRFTVFLPNLGYPDSGERSARYIFTKK